MLNSDVRALACDGWLCPVRSDMRVEAHWGISASEVPNRPGGWSTDTLCIRCLPKSDQERQSSHMYYDHPQPYLACVVGEDGSPPLEHLRLALRSFLALVKEDLEARERRNAPSRFGRAVPFVALPIFGAGFATRNIMRGDDNAGSIIVMVLRELDAFTSENSVDVALCSIDAAAYGAAQQARRFLLGEQKTDHAVTRYSRLYRLRAPAGAADPVRYHDEVERLAERFSDGQVSLFLGAGVSINAGLPSWTQLLERLAVDLGMPAEERDALALLNPLEAATICAGRLAGGEPELKRRCAAILASAKRHSLQHALLAGLPFKGCVTTNYDELFEMAVAGAGADMAKLPEDIGSVHDRWCLKLHGTCSRPESIVLTRHDYGVYNKEQAASEAVLQALLMTQHVLFVGFSMRDENWCRICETIRSSLGADVRERGERGEAEGHTRAGAEPADSATLGTMLPLECDSLFDLLWTSGKRPLLQVTAMRELIAPDEGASTEGPQGGGAPPRVPAPRSARGDLRWAHVAHLARELEIFLDHVASAVESRQCRILLNSKYKDSLLSPRALALSAAIEEFLDKLPADAKQAGPFQPLLNVFLQMGLRTETARRICEDPTIEGPYRRRLSKLLDYRLAKDAEARRRSGRKPSPLAYMQ